MNKYRIIYCHNNPTQPWYTFYTNDVRRAFMAGTALVETAQFDAMVETPDGWLFIHVDKNDGMISLELMDDEGASAIHEMITEEMIVDHPLSDIDTALEFLMESGNLPLDSDK